VKANKIQEQHKEHSGYFPNMSNLQRKQFCNCIQDHFPIYRFLTHTNYSTLIEDHIEKVKDTETMQSISG